MALEDNRVITNPDLIAANNPSYGVGQVQSVRPNMFKGLTNQQQRNMTYSADELDRGYKSVVPVQQVQPTVDPLSGHESVGHGSVVQTPKTQNMVTAGGIAGGNGKAPQYSQPRPQITSMDELAAAMGYTSPEEEARLRKASVNNQRILAVADALRHIGNIANTANYAPSQQFNRPWAEEQARYEQGKAMRDKANNALLAYQQQRARQDALQKQWEAEQQFKRDKAAADAEALKAYRDGQLKRKDDALDYRKQNDEANRQMRQKQYDRQNEFAQQRIDLSASKKGGTSSRGGRRGGGKGGNSGGKYWAYDEEGNIHYYPNKTMYEQGVEQFSKGLSNSETYNATDSNGRPTQKSTRRKIVSKGGELARNAQNRQRYKNTAKLLGKFKQNK